MHGTVDSSVEQGLLDFLGEQPLATDIAQQAVLDAIPARLDNGDRDTVLGEAGIGGQKRGLHRMRLPKRERAAAGADGELSLHDPFDYVYPRPGSMARTAREHGGASLRSGHRDKL